MVSQPKIQLSSVDGLSKTGIKGIMAKALDPLHCADVRIIEEPVDLDLFKRTYLYQMVFDKYVTLLPEDAVKRAEACTVKYLECERRCRAFNEFFSSGRHRRSSNYEILIRARAIITRILGDTDLKELFENTGFGPGASTRLNRQYGDASFKFDGTPHATRSLINYLPGYFDNYPNIGKFVATECSNYITVPKNSTIDRPIEIQPEMNVFFQKSIGSYIRKRMKGLRTGYSDLLIDLNSQEVNRELCRIGSIDGSLATIDLSSASDLISCGLVANLVEDEYFFEALVATRVGSVRMPERELKLEKFSAMGNGYTWELQSLIFYALALAVCEHCNINKPVVATFGDDIIISSTAAPQLINFLSWCGLRVNATKSYWEGFFRESCGKHYYRGHDVSPVYLREPLSGPVQSMKFHNRLIEWSSRDGFISTRLLELLQLLRRISRNLYHYIPYGTGDVGLYTCASEDLVSYRYSKRRGCLLFKAHVIVFDVLTNPGMGSFVKSLHKYNMTTSSKDIPWGKGRLCLIDQGIYSPIYIGGWR